MDYVLHEHLDFKPTWSICNTISDNIVIQLIWKFQESNWNPDSFGTNYIFTNNKNLGQYDQNAIPSQIMPCYSYPGNLINQNEIPIELTCQQAHLGLIMSLMSMKMLANMVHIWYSLRWCHVTGILQVCLINLKSLLTHRVNELIWKWLCPWWAWRCWQIWLICNTIWENAMLKLFCKFGPLKWNPCWLIMLN